MTPPRDVTGVEPVRCGGEVDRKDAACTASILNCRRCSSRKLRALSPCYSELTYVGKHALHVYLEELETADLAFS